MLTTKEIMSWIIGGLIVAVVSWLLISIPAFVGKARKVSSSQLKLIRLIAIFGVIFGVITLFASTVLAAILELPNSIAGVIFILSIVVGGLAWVVALILSIVFAPEKIVRAVSLNYGDPVPTVPPPPPPVAHGASRSATATATATLDTCENCGRTIGKLETPNVWEDHVVCAHCYKTLSTA